MDIILYNILVAFCSLFFGYIFGSIPTGVIVGKVFFRQDPREKGSKNSGGTNVGRLFGKKAGAIVIILDMFKCIVPLISVWSIVKFSGLSKLLEGDTWNKFHVLYIYLSAFGVVLGHCWPIFAGFKGGKAVATYCGFGICTSWLVFIVGFLSFGIVLKLKKYVSLSSILSSITVTVICWILYILKILVFKDSINIIMWGAGEFLLFGWEYAAVMTAISFVLIVRHKANIIRLIQHNENKIKWMK